MWSVRTLILDRNAPNRSRRLVAQGTLLAFGIALLQMAHSATCVFCFVLGAGLTLVAALFHSRTDPVDLRAVTRNELRVIQLGIAAGLSVAVILAPPLWPLIPVAAIGYLVHLAVAAPPSELAHAWRVAPAAHARGRPK